MDEQKYICPNCGGLVDYSSKFCPHCRYEFGEWAAQAVENKTTQTETGSIDDETIPAEENGSKTSMFVIIAVLLAVIGGAVYWFMNSNDTEKIVAEAIKTGNMAPVFELYRNAPDTDKPQVAYNIADAAFEITLKEVAGNDNRKFLQTLYEAVNNDKNANLHIEAGGRDEYMSPFIALVKYAYVQSTLEKMVNETKADIENYLPANKGINADNLNPREVRNIYAWVDQPLDGGYVLYGTQRLFFETFPNFRNCLGVLYLPNGADGSELPGYAYNGDVLQIGTTTLTWKNGREQDVPEYLLIHPQFKELLWKNNTLKDVYKPLDLVQQDLKTMHENLGIIKKHYKNATPNLNFDGLNFNSTEDEFYSKAPLQLQKGEGTIHITNVFANGVVVDFMPYFNYQVQDSVSVSESFTGSFSNGIKIGDSQNQVAQKMQPYYQLSAQPDWLNYLMPNGQIYSFCFDDGKLYKVNVREAPDWKN